VLAARLKHLQESGVVRRTTLPPPAASTVYELTELGQGLRPLVHELFKWGGNFMGFPRPGEHFRLGWLLAAMQASFRPELARGLHETYEFRVDGELFHVIVDDGTIELREGMAPDPGFVLASDLPTFMAVATRQLSPDEAEASGRVTFHGDRAAAERSIAILGPHFAAAGPAGGILGAIRAVLQSGPLGGVDATFEFRIDDHVVHARIADGQVDVREGSPPVEPDLVLTADLGTFVAIGTGQLDPSEADATLEGDPEAVRLLGDLLGAYLTGAEAV
jgi:putative sterol carrier protein